MKIYKKTRNAAALFDVDESFLTHGKDKHFFLGVHFFVPFGTKLLRWDIEALEKWFRTVSMEDLDVCISKMLS